ncbi:MAG TPA: hypothetical protein ENK49_12405 [Gammaproteobacteria bacterium]|nr:hypothetical protein [Gammaproteobacteria bacterium]
MNRLAATLYTAALCSLLLACGNPNQRLDEQVFYDGPEFKLKVVRYYRNIPFNPLGEQAIVMCRSENTREFQSDEQQDAGWRSLGAVNATGSKDAAQAALRIRDNYRVLDDHTLFAIISAFNISFDACGHFIHWDPTRLPPDMIDAVEKPGSCAPRGPVDCRYYDFEGKRAPRYEQIRVTGKGQVSFTASSTSFRDIDFLRVQTRNHGAVWQVDSTGSEPGEREWKPGSLHSLSIPEAGDRPGNTRLMDWFESVLPPGSMVIWPDRSVACEDRRCAGIRFNDREGNSGTLYITMPPETENGTNRASFHSGRFIANGRSQTIESFTDLRKKLAVNRP